MAIEISESEMQERFVDGLKKASSRAREFLTTEAKEKPRLFVDFIDGIKVAAGSAHQLAHAQMNPKWLGMRDILEAVIHVGQQMPVFTTEQSPLWSRIADDIDKIRYKGTSMYLAKAATDEEIDEDLDIRLRAAGLELPN